MPLDVRVKNESYCTAGQGCVAGFAGRPRYLSKFKVNYRRFPGDPPLPVIRRIFKA